MSPLRAPKHISLTACAFSLVASIALLVIFNRAIRTDGHGTVVFAELTQSDIVVAADSRTTFPGEGFDDSTCKIIALNNDVIFASTGYTMERRSDGWTSRSVASSAMQSHHVANEADLLVVRDAWAREMSEKIENAAQKSLQVFGEAGYGDGVTSGFFAARLNDGKIEFAAADLHRSTGPPIPAWKTTITPYQFVNPTTIPAPAGSGVGQPMLEELLAGGSDRAKAASEVALRITTARKLAEMESAALSFARLAEWWYPLHVGGEIDEIHLGQNGVEWLHKKPSCPSSGDILPK